jgi:hypothetical protein
MVVTPPRILAELEALAERLGVTVRTEPFIKGALGGRGGFCHIRGKAFVVMDAALPVADRIAVLAGALSRFDLDSVFVPPALRARIESAALGTRRAGAGRSATAPKPLPKLALPGLARTRPRG